MLWKWQYFLEQISLSVETSQVPDTVLVVVHYDNPHGMKGSIVTADAHFHSRCSTSIGSGESDWGEKRGRSIQDSHMRRVHVDTRVSSHVFGGTGSRILCYMLKSGCYWGKDV